jgi:hypothetical protein
MNKIFIYQIWNSTVKSKPPVERKENMLEIIASNFNQQLAWSGGGVTPSSRQLLDEKSRFFLILSAARGFHSQLFCEIKKTANPYKQVLNKFTS